MTTTMWVKKIIPLKMPLGGARTYTGSRSIIGLRTYEELPLCESENKLMKGKALRKHSLY